jgi:hypothetical protein
MVAFRVRRSSRWVSAVDAYEFPSGVRQRFTLQHGELSAAALRSVEAAARQWFRIAARHPKARLAMPSVIVDEFCREFRLQAREYTDFCAVVLGRPAVVAGNGPRELAATFRFAREDESSQAGMLPALFRVDRDVAAAGGQHYLADCGGRGICYELKGSVCLLHLGGAGTGRTGGEWDVRRGGGVPVDGYNRGSGCGLGD